MFKWKHTVAMCDYLIRSNKGWTCRVSYLVSKNKRTALCEETRRNECAELYAQSIMRGMGGLPTAHEMTYAEYESRGRTMDGVTNNTYPIQNDL